MNFTGVIIEESLENGNVLKHMKIIKTEVEEVTEKHRTPHLKQWTLHTVEIEEGRADEMAQELSKSLHGGSAHNNWYADYRNDTTHYIVFRGKIFKIDRASKAQYDAAKQYGLSLGIPEYQVDFHPQVQEWKR